MYVQYTAAKPIVAGCATVAIASCGAGNGIVFDYLIIAVARNPSLTNQPLSCSSFVFVLR